MQIQGIIGAIPHSEYKRRRAGWNPRRPEDRRPTMKECAVCLSICSAGSVLRSPGWPATPTPIVSRWLRPYHRPQSAYPASPLHPTQPPQPAYPRWMPPSAASTTSRSRPWLPHRIRAVDPPVGFAGSPRQRGGDGRAQKLGSMIQLKVSNTAKNRTLTAE